MPTTVSGCGAANMKDNVASMLRLDATTPLFVYFTAEWVRSMRALNIIQCVIRACAQCPDCSRSNPLIDEAFWNKNVSLQLLKVDVGDKKDFKDPGFFLRNDTDWKLTCIPTLAAVDASGKPLRRIAKDLESCSDVAAARAMIADFIRDDTQGEKTVAASAPPQSARLGAGVITAAFIVALAIAVAFFSALRY